MTQPSREAEKREPQFTNTELTPEIGLAQIPLRHWQHRAFDSWLLRQDTDFLLVATPGAGKTLLALCLALHLLRQGRVRRIVIVCPTEHLRRQWANAAHSLGLALDPRFSNSDGLEVAADYSGIVVTYQQVMFAPSLFRKQCEDTPTFVIFDEVHHAGDNLAWGAALREGCQAAVERLALSGTPFRSDNCPIPFITYHEGRSRADFAYSYAEALADGVCSPIYFPTLNGRARFLSHDGSFVDCWLLDDLPRAHAGERLRTVLDARGAWMTSVLRAADEELTRVRAAGHAEAGGLVVAIDQEHAKQIAQQLRRLTGTEPLLAISEDSDASNKINRFARGDTRFLVCVRMVSEGVDIPRLRVGVYATNIKSELFLRQFAGRFVRGRQSATMYIPAVEPITAFARQIKEERDHVLAQAIHLPDLSAQHAQSGQGGDEPVSPASTFTPLGSTSLEHDTIYNGESFTVEELKHAKRLQQEFNVPLDAPVLAALLRHHDAKAGVFVLHQDETDVRRDAVADSTPDEPTGSSASSRSTASDATANGDKTVQGVARVSPSPSQPEVNPELPLYERKDQLRRQTQAATSKLAGLIGVRPFVVHKQWIEMGGMPQGAATEEDLERKLAHLLERIREVKRDRP
jgi:superfamily II DNA or RNA helicase